MDRYPVIVYLGAAILCKVGAEMIFTDPMVAKSFQPTAAIVYVMEALFAIGVVAIGKYLFCSTSRCDIAHAGSRTEKKIHR